MAVNRFDQLINAWDPKLRKAFLDAVYAMRNAADISKIAERLEKGDVDGAIRAVGLDPTQFRIFDKTITEAFEAGGVYTGNSIPSYRDGQGFRVRFQFNIRNPAAENWLRNHSGNLIRDVLDDQRQMIRNVMRDGMVAGANPRTKALDLVGRVGASGNREGGMIGLTDSQTQWVKAYEAELRSDRPGAALERALRDTRFDGTVVRAAKEGRTLTASEIEPMVKAYTNRALRYRAETIARKEAITALHEAQEQAMRQAIGSGAIVQSAVTYTWRSAHDKRVRDAHRQLDGVSVADGEVFQSILGPIRYPGDPFATAANVIGCRCWREPKVDFLAGIR